MYLVKMNRILECLGACRHLFYSALTPYCWIHMCLCRFNIFLEYVNSERESPGTLVLCAERIMHSIIFSVNISHRAAAAVDCKNGNRGCELFPRCISKIYSESGGTPFPRCLTWRTLAAVQQEGIYISCTDEVTRSQVWLLTSLKVQSWRLLYFLIKGKGHNFLAK